MQPVAATPCATPTALCTDLEGNKEDVDRASEQRPGSNQQGAGHSDNHQHGQAAKEEEDVDAGLVEADAVGDDARRQVSARDTVQAAQLENLAVVGREDQALHADAHAGRIVPEELRKHGTQRIGRNQAAHEPDAKAAAVPAGAAGVDNELADKVQRRGAEEEEPGRLEEEDARQAPLEDAHKDAEEGEAVLGLRGGGGGGRGGWGGGGREGMVSVGRLCCSRSTATKRERAVHARPKQTAASCSFCHWASKSASSCAPFML